MKRGQMVDGSEHDTHQTKGNKTVMSILKCHNKKEKRFLSQQNLSHLANRKENIIKVSLT